MTKKSHNLLLFLGIFFISNALLAEFIGVKIFSLEKSLHLPTSTFKIFGNDLSLNFTTGVLIWPFVFITTDIINEYFGKNTVKKLSYLAIGIIIYAFFVISLAIQLAPADFWETQDNLNMQKAFSAVFGQGLWIIIGSLVAFLVGQIIDVYVFQWLGKKFNHKNIWLKATGSTMISQLIDSYVVLLIAFYIGADWPLDLVLAVGTLNYIYKIIAAITLSPLLYIVHHYIDKYLGKDESEKLQLEARNH